MAAREIREDGSEDLFFVKLWETSKIKIIIFFVWFTLVILITEIYLSTGNNRDDVMN